ncbi:MAG TPA: TIGR03118 family protein [Verrucomicrobiae bacterium]|nr:TIGR03118 family protein [Verrucomicrobiae bacterium]
MTHSILTRLGALSLLIGGIASTLAAQSSPPNSYLTHNLVSDLPGLADHQDPNLVNPWGNGFAATPFWVGNNGSGTSTLYDGTGAITPLVVTIPQAGGAGNAGPVTGVIFNSFSANTAAFAVAAGKPSSFLFCTEEGVIAGWNSSASGTAASILFDNSKSGAVYKGCALGGTSTAPLLFAANFNAGRVDVYDGSLNLNPGAFAKSFANAAIPAGFAPFNVQIMNGAVYVTYAKQDDEKHDDVAGPGNGYLAVFDQTGALIGNLVTQGALNSPWGMAVAPSTFGPFAGALLVGNFGDGKINAYNFSTGKQLGTLNDPKGNPIAFPGLWSIDFGSGARNEDPATLYFTAGIAGGPNNDPVESHGLLGSIQPAPVFTAANVSAAGVGAAGQIAPNTWVTIKGNALSPVTANWTVSGATLPTTPVAGVGVTVNGEAAPVSFVSNQQINFLVPADIQSGTAQVVVASGGLTGTAVPVTVAPLAPALFPLGTVAATGHTYITATHANFTDVAPANFISTTVASTPAAPGETIAVFGTGFGPSASGQLPVLPTVVIDGLAANVTFAGMISPGLYQINAVVPAGVTHAQDALVVVLLADSETQANAYIAIQ